MMGAKALERIDDRLNAIQPVLEAALPGRLVERGFIPYETRSQPELLQGVVNLVASDEGHYNAARGMAAREGTLQLILSCHLQVEEAQTSAELQQAEIDLAEQIKAFVRGGVQGMSLSLESLQLSRQLEHPYGWVVAFINIRPPAAATQ
ncbi:hypothetical protein [Candidatus Endoriftia persephonae]|jgi:hypothetical protein|uniref:Uncharacterized protein n=2 Tax=Gammaproteobacteria TaxID=1236 RepID=G2FD80_9GAMM|nr:hypothetical protein [Candidatus Endoriftia persephone]EGW55166.1 hypothetical protein TevJSym_ae00230 [endosymbiont of Tevnia jerichonana (vent Tica)]USF88746.1 hypothetical protein L0Y14_05805 [Candidatus Endoriftia persephone]